MGASASFGPPVLGSIGFLLTCLVASFLLSFIASLLALSFSFLLAFVLASLFACFLAHLTLYKYFRTLSRLRGSVVRRVCSGIFRCKGASSMCNNNHLK